MSKLEDALQAAGYTTCNIDYPSTEHAIAELATQFVVPAIQQCRNGSSEPISVVTHSMGGIMIRYIAHHLASGEATIPLARVVMLGPPNHGSELVDRMRPWWLFRWVNGPAGQQLGTDAESVPNSLGPAKFEVGIIAGNKPFLEPFKGFIAGPSDGKVSLESTKLEGMTDYLILPVTHSLMMRDSQVIEQVLSFLKTGSFTKRVEL
jgi:triacylglycerol lipase